MYAITGKSALHYVIHFFIIIFKFRKTIFIVYFDIFKIKSMFGLRIISHVNSVFYIKFFKFCIKRARKYSSVPVIILDCTR